MKKFYFILFIQIAVFVSINAQNILIVGQSSSTADYDDYMTNHIQIVADVIGAIDGILVDIQDADVVTSGSFDFSAYDGIVITEAAGSSTIKTIGTYTDDVVSALPVMNMKTYAIHDGKGGWDWCPQDDFVTIDVALWDSTLVEDQAIMLVTEEHPILTGFSKNDELLLFESAWKGGAHFQALSFDNSADPYVSAAATSLGVSPFILENSESNIGEMLWAIEENKTSPRNVILGVHAQFGDFTDAFKSILTNSVLWMMDMEIVGVNETKSDLKINTYPNPTNDILNISFDSNGSDNVNITVFDVTGKDIYSQTTSSVSGSQIHTIDVSDYAEGLYIVSVSTDNNSQRIKMIKK